MTNLESFISLYKQFGIELKISQTETGTEIILREGDNEKFSGYFDFFSTIKFDINGKFINQSFWE
jgi:hypothetical protein